MLAPDDPVFTTPNTLGAETWTRLGAGARHCISWASATPRYVDLLRSTDPFPYNSGAKTGALVEARVGKGRWIYIGLGLGGSCPPAPSAPTV